MFNNEELTRNTGYWLDQIQNEIYFELKQYMDKNKLNQTGLAKELGVSPGYISQVLNGNFNHSLKKLIDLSLAINKAPKIEFIDINEEVTNLNKFNTTKIIDLDSFQEIEVKEGSSFSPEKYCYA